MPDRELVLREKCEHGSTWGHSCAAHPQCALFRGDAHRCPGGSETVLHPDRVLQIEDPEFGEISFIRVQDVIDAVTE